MHLAALKRLEGCASDEDQLHSGMTDVLQGVAPITASIAGSGMCLSEDEVLEFIEGRLHEQDVRTLDGHLNRCGACAQLLVETLRAMHGDTQSGANQPTFASVFAPGALLAERFRVLRLVGRGGMGEVYEVFDQQTQCRVALKTVSASRCDHPRSWSRFRSEARLCSKVCHPNVCRVLEVGVEDADAGAGERLYFLTMPFVEGPTLGKCIRTDGRWPLEQALPLARDLLLGLQALHQVGVVHLDFKSDNIMLASEASRTRAVIIDFGLARRLRSGTTVSAARSVSGTISYMAPEQLLGLPRGPFTDVFAFGVVLFEVLTGELPVVARHLSARSAPARVAQLPLRPSRVLPTIPAAVDSFVAKCTRTAPGERYADASAALDGLVELLARC